MDFAFIRPNITYGRIFGKWNLGEYKYRNYQWIYIYAIVGREVRVYQLVHVFFFSYTLFGFLISIMSRNSSKQCLEMLYDSSPIVWMLTGVTNDD